MRLDLELPFYYNTSQWRMQDFFKGGSVTILRAKILEVTPICGKTTPNPAINLFSVEISAKAC